MNKLRLTASSLALATAMIASHASAGGVFEVIHPDVDHGGFELEILNGFALENVDSGEEESVHEFALGYGVTSFWKTTFAVEFANIDGEGFEYEAFEWENVFLLPLGGHDDDHGHDGDHSGEGFALEALGFYAALEVPDEGGFDDGAVVLGPIAEVQVGPVSVLGNLFVEIPFDGDEDEGLVYAAAASVPVSDTVAIGVEGFGEIENAFGSGGSESAHFIGPAAYFELEVDEGLEIEPRLAVLFGIEDETPDATLSLNIEIKF